MDPLPFGLFFLILLSGFFSGAEISLVSLNKIDIHRMIKNKVRGASMIEILKKNPQKLLITILVGNNLVNIAASVLTTYWVTIKFGNQFLGITTGILTLLILIFGEIIPKTIAERFPQKFALISARALYYLQFLLFPIIWVLEKKLNLFLKTIGGKNKKITEEEIKAMLTVSAEEGAIENEEKELINNIMEFDETKVAQIMTPRAKIASLNNATTIDKAIDYILEEGYSRIPVYNGKLDSITGVVTIQDILKAKKHRTEDTCLKDLELKVPIIIPEAKPLNDLFKEFQWKYQHMAIVVNEHGSVTGLVTMEDLLEEIVGEIVDESDSKNKNVMIEKISDFSWQINAELTIEELNEALQENFTCDDEHKSVGYLLLENFKKIPRRGEDIQINNYHFFVSKMEGNKIQSVRIVKIEK